MAKYFIIVDKNSGEQTSTEGSGLYSVSNDTDLDLYPVHKDCMLVELTQAEAGSMQEVGFEVVRDGKVVFEDSISNILKTDRVLDGKPKNKINTKKATKRLKNRKVENVTVNEFGIHYQDMKPVTPIKSRRKAKK